MLRTIGKTVGMAIAGMCLASTLAMAQPAAPGQMTQPTAPGQTMLCTKVDMNGYCIEAKAQDNKVVTIRVENVQINEKITCTTADGNTTCTKVITTVK